MHRFILYSLAGLIALSGCDCGDDDPPADEDAGMEGDVGPGVDTGPPPDGAPMCTPAGGTCVTSVDCCAGNTCVDEGGMLVCRAMMCAGAPCMLDADCCEGFGCNGGTCEMGALCATVGEACADALDCCSNTCTGGMCADNPAVSCEPLGEACADRSECCSDRCAAPDGAPCAGGADCRCAGAAACRAQDDLCTNDAQCCVGLCDRPMGAMIGTCAAEGSCGVAGQPCGSEGFSGSCCSTVCLDAAGTGTPTCQPLGGCRVQDEPCTSDAQCCSGGCTESGVGADGRPIMRCDNTGSCVPAGEVCGGMGATSNCCPDGGGDTGCVPASLGIRRCRGGDTDCVLPGEVCMMTSDCCVDTYPDIMCSPGLGDVMRCCLPDGHECDFADVCCGGICAPDSMGVLRCGATCVPDGGACTAAADCCGCACVADGMGGMRCSSDPADCGACMLGDLGDPCTMDSDCCNTPTVRCNNDAGVEFPTCILAGAT